MGFLGALAAPLVGIAGGAVQGLFGSGGQKGSGFQAQGANILPGTDPNQVGQAYGQTQQGLAQQQAFLNALAQQNQNVFGQQANLANQLVDQSQGLGPNPALAQLNQATGQNVNQQAALMASQRGAGANAGLLARQAAQQGANIQQNAVGQAAIMRANQQLAAQQQLAQLANQQIGQQNTALTGYNQFAQNQQQNLLNALAQQNNANVTMQGNINNANAGIAQGNQSFQNNALRGGIDAAGQVLGKIGPTFFGDNKQDQPQQQGNGFSLGVNTAMGQMQKPAFLNQGGMVSGKGPKSQAAQHLLGMSQGGKVQGQAKVAGDSLKNDTVSAKLSPGEIVIPRSIAQSDNAPEKAAAFVRAILARNGR